MTLLKPFVIFTFVALIASSAVAQDRRLNIKGLYLGMDIMDAKRVAEKVLGEGWRVEYEKHLNTKDGYYKGDQDIFGKEKRIRANQTSRPLLDTTRLGILKQWLIP